MIYITGDCHGDFERFTQEIFPEGLNMTKDDFVIICGDFGGVWEIDTKEGGWRAQFDGHKHDCRMKTENNKLDWLDSMPFTTLFVCGNHENFDRLNEYPVEEWHGGHIHKIRPSIFHLMRGEVFDLQGKKFFAFGGAASHDDIDGGISFYLHNIFLNQNLTILNPWDIRFNERRIELNYGTLPYRINGVSWWSQELASDEEKINGWKNLQKHNYKVDFIITHCCSTSSQVLLGGAGLYTPDHQTDYLEEVRQKVDFKKWFFGHYHVNRNVNDKEICIYEQIIRVC